jgi:O-antigen/teichoic acid export membrane protein
MSSMANDCFLVASTAFIINLPISLINRIYISSQLGYITNVINIFSSIISLLGILISVHMKLGMQYLILIVSSGPIIANIGAWLYMPRVLPWYQVNMGFVSMSALHRVARSSIPLFMFQIGSLLVNEMVNIVIAQVGTLNMVADYNVLLRIYLVIFSLGLGLSSPFYPAIRDAYERKEKFWIVQSIYRLIKIRTAIIFIPAVILLIGGDWLIKAWIRLPLDSKFGIIGWSVFLLTLFLSSIGSSFGEILLGLDVIWSQVWLVFLSAIIIIIAMYCFIPKFGLAGIFISTALSTIYPMFWGGNKLKKVLQGI